MAYTPINWQTGDTITAEKMNKMDNGWSVTSTTQTVFNDSVTTILYPEYPDDPAWGEIQTLIIADSLVVTFNGTEYVCPATNEDGFIAYGGYSNGSPDFTNYPFCIEAVSSDSITYVATPDAGTYTVKIEANIESVETTTEFGKARGYWTEISSTEEIFSETVVTENDGDFNSGVLSYSEEVPDGTLTVTFDGTDYTCTCSDAMFGSLDESFEDYPFMVFYSGKQQSNIIDTATEGTHTIAVSAGGGETIETSSDFSAAVNSCVETPTMPSMVINMEDAGVLQTDKTWDEINAVFIGGGICAVVGYGPVLQMWGDGNGYGYMATGYTYSGNIGKFDPYIFRTPQSEAVGIQRLQPYKYNSQMP